MGRARVRAVAPVMVWAWKDMMANRDQRRTPSVAAAGRAGDQGECRVKMRRCKAGNMTGREFFPEQLRAAGGRAEGG